MYMRIHHDIAGNRTIKMTLCSDYAMHGRVEWSTGDTSPVIRPGSSLGPVDVVSCNAALYSLYVQIYLSTISCPSETSAASGTPLLSSDDGRFGGPETDASWRYLSPEPEPVPMPGSEPMGPRRRSYDTPVTQSTNRGPFHTGTRGATDITNGADKFNLDSYLDFLSSHS